MYMGRYSHSVDAKNRVFLPSKWRFSLSETVAIAKDESSSKTGCLQCMPWEDWLGYINGFTKVDRLNESALGIVRRLASSVECCAVDKQGRIVIPQDLKDYAGIGEDVVFIGVLDRIELWDTERWASYNESVEENYDERITAIKAEIGERE
ncbi:MAG: division/cell wall cluster transcriptional repressor MraZ [Clostridiales bacterium]|jgi:MraZ protein|nr:division/cell wall cluster transcriptional repressor MraZ [Clostridiales bacterium]